MCIPPAFQSCVRINYYICKMCACRFPITWSSCAYYYLVNRNSIKYLWIKVLKKKEQYENSIKLTKSQDHYLNAHRYAWVEQYVVEINSCLVIFCVRKTAIIVSGYIFERDYRFQGDLLLKLRKNKIPV